MNIEKQAQSRIRRKMLEQQLAVPYDLNAENLLNRMSEKMLKDIDSQMLETNPIIKINCKDDKILINPIPPEKVYRSSGLFSGEQYGKDVARNIMDNFSKEDVWKWPNFNHAVTKADEYIEREDSRIELTLTNGVFE